MSESTPAEPGEVPWWPTHCPGARCGRELAAIKDGEVRVAEHPAGREATYRLAVCWYCHLVYAQAYTPPEPMPTEPTPLSLTDPCPLCSAKPKAVIMPARPGDDARIEHADGRVCRLRWWDGRWVMA